VLRVLRSRNYRLFWSDSFIANLGVWVQQIALGWLVYDMTRKASLLGAIAARASRSTIMLGTLSVIATTALALSLLTATGDIAVWHIVAIS